MGRLFKRLLCSKSFKFGQWKSGLIIIHVDVEINGASKVLVLKSTASSFVKVLPHGIVDARSRSWY